MSARLFILSIFILLFTSCDSLHKQEDYQVFFNICARDAAMTYENRFKSGEAQKLYNEAIFNCQKKVEACRKSPGGKVCKNFRLRYLVNHP